MDGVGFVSQPPIDGGSSFDYIFKADPSGTHWYHSHIGTQKSDGLFGGLIIRERQNLSEILSNNMYDNVIDNAGQHTLTLIDWQRKGEFIQQSLAGLGFYPQLPIGQVPTNRDTAFSDHHSTDGASLGHIAFWSGLINGKGRMNENISTPLSIFRVEQGNVYHFRLIGSISIYALRVSIDGHKLTAIASDGMYFQPVEVDYIIIHAGETYDFLLDANNQDGTNFWIRAETLEEPPVPEHSARGILTYGDPKELNWTNAYSNIPERVRECTANAPCKALNCPFLNYPTSYNILCIPFTSLLRKTATEDTDIPMYPPNPNCDDCTHFLNFATDGKGNVSSVNSNSFQIPHTSYATNCFQYEEEKNDNMTNTCNKCTVDINSSTGGCRCIDIVQVANNDIFNSPEPPSIAMVLSSFNVQFAHPIHLHGHSYHIVYVGYGKYNDTTGQLIVFTDDIDCGNGNLCVNPKWKNGVPQAVLNRTSNGQVISSAIRKDTVIIPAGGYVVIAFQAINPGYWIMHCHIEEHLLGGMAIIVQEYSSDQQWAPPPGMNLHGSFNWNVDDYRRTLSKGETCSMQSPTTPQTEPVRPGDESFVISRVGFAISMVVIAVLVIVVTALIIVLFLMWYYRIRKKHQLSQEMYLLKETSTPHEEEIAL